MSEPTTAARCVPLCAAGNKAPWWQHEVPCPVRVAHEAAQRECSICHRVQSVDVFGNPNAPDICEGCYRLVGVDIWAAGDE